MMGYKAFPSAAATLAGMEVAHMIRKGQFAANGKAALQQFAALVAWFSGMVMSETRRFKSLPKFEIEPFRSGYNSKTTIPHRHRAHDVVSLIVPDSVRFLSLSPLAT
jgi:putative transposase